MRAELNTEKNIAPAITCKASWRLTKIKSLEDYTLEVEFIDGTRGFVKMRQLISNSRAGVFAKLADINNFNKVYTEYGVATWPDGIDLAPDTMYNEITRSGTWYL